MITADETIEQEQKLLAEMAAAVSLIDDDIKTMMLTHDRNKMLGRLYMIERYSRDINYKIEQLRHSLLYL